MSDSTAETEQSSSAENGRLDGATVGEQTGRPNHVETAEEIDWRGWLLVGAVVVSFLVIPVLVLFIPRMSGLIASLGFSQRQAYLVFPMIPAIVLGLISVWAAVSTQTN